MSWNAHNNTILGRGLLVKYIFVTEKDKDSHLGLYSTHFMSVPQCKYGLEPSLLCLNKHFVSSALLAINNDFVVTWQQTEE